MLSKMGFLWKLWAIAVLLSIPVAARAVTCAAQAELPSQALDPLASVATQLSAAVQQQDYPTLQAALAPEEASAWAGIQAAAQQAAPLLTGGKIELHNLYLLDASTQTAPADTEFFCSNPSGSLTVTITMHDLPPSKYALVLAEATGAPLDGQLGLVLAWDGSSSSWRLAGLSAHQGMFDGHDGVWYWQRARGLSSGDPWSAWFCYDAARYLLLPVDFLSSPNLQKLDAEQEQITNSPQKTLPLSIPAGDRTWKIDAVTLDPSLHEPDLAVAYESTGVTDPAALRTEATVVLSAFLKTQPGIRENFHGLWAYAVYNGKRTPVMELPMKQIP
jgi:hypothetical protein